MPFVATDSTDHPTANCYLTSWQQKAKIKTVVDGAIGRSVHLLKNKSGAGTEQCNMRRTPALPKTGIVHKTTATVLAFSF